MLRLSELEKGQKAKIEKIEEHFSAIQLMEMGFVAGKSVELDHIAPMGDPIAVRIAGYLLSIRKQDASFVWVSLF
ncbi:MAG TPA: FeoA family protein [Edaphocola sp.]|nr:FeoA family protein [Edaphocola sp.]